MVYIATLENSLTLSQIVQARPTICPSHSTPKSQPNRKKKKKKYACIEICAWVFTAVLFVLLPNWRKFEQLLTGK